jgi:tetratricopeptide (TPR) repeat protein
MKGEKEHMHNQAIAMNTAKADKAFNPGKWKYYLALAIIVLISCFVYLPVLQNGFVWDDDFYIRNNPLIHSINLKEIFSQNVLGNYHPLTILALAIEYHFFGLNETGYHAVNLLLHLLNVILVFYAVFLLTDKAGIALVASLLFGIHPMHVESVAWVSELKDLLYTFFFLASYILYLKYLKDLQKKFYVFALFLFAVSLLSKAMAASLPVVMMLTDYFKGRKINKKTVIEKAPFFLLAISFGVVAVIAQKSTGALQDFEDFTFIQSIVLACYAFINYLYKLILPLNLSAYYPYPVKSGGNIPIQYYTYLILFAGLVLSVFYSIRFNKKIFFGVGFFAITVFLVLQLLPVGGAIMADRYSYIPSIGIFYLAGEGFNLLWGKKIKLIAVILLSAFTIFYSVRTYTRCEVWKNGMTLWTDVLNQNQISYAYYNRGIFLMTENRTDEAMDDFSKAIEINLKYTQAYVNRGVIYMNEKKYDLALDDFNAAIQLDPNLAEAYYNRGIVSVNINNNDQAMSDFSKTIQLQPDYVNAFFNRGIVYMREKMNDKALSDFGHVIKLKPDFYQAYVKQGIIYFNETKYEEAIINFSKAITVKSDYGEAYYNRGLAKYYSGKKDAACLDINQAANLGFKPAADVLSQICK